ncbi:glucan endo-1 3-beta-glucosidase 1 [Phtheirospermum japonicum]|uniref:Glucan endo-1 3-beta-glucosidase 1 n=1 Tax=Phtheirospermum japonicum TaxID=374723 RepID=A0A830DDW1_9LAMI|nr:glucan endo-1 3-beta-glucosidase 1 [Phtheirospermum japonicum]GFQ07899.1 glucan endo-1 3-beta-glucosidase 1 [Phtheirospermum japonicum]
MISLHNPRPVPTFPGLLQPNPSPNHHPISPNLFPDPIPSNDEPVPLLRLYAEERRCPLRKLPTTIKDSSENC